MIDRSEILAVSTDLSLSADVVEKDYVLGWLLAGIYAHPDLARQWIFKGGTCLKKCYFETYRFSEDLDFTVSAEAQLDAGFLANALRDVAAWVYENTGIEVPTDQIRLDVYRNKRQGLSCEGRLYYNGPLRRVSSLPRVKLDLTADELLVLPAVERPVNHPYSDNPEGGIAALSYAYEEVLAEKTRALAERTRPRDLYDVINLFRHGEFHPAAVQVLDVLRQKCAFKGIPIPTLASLGGALDELTGDWEAMLKHQLPTLPPFESFWAELPQFFAWLETGTAMPVLPAAPLAATEEVFRPAVGFLRRHGIRGSSALETIRFAASNRLCVDLDYMPEQGRLGVRRIEPYSLRRTQAGDILLFAIRVMDGQLRSYRLDRIRGAVVTDQIFSPRFLIELTP
jgi:predicted nucleotidyltransferase component of viral defense system